MYKNLALKLYQRFFSGFNFLHNALTMLFKDFFADKKKLPESSKELTTQNITRLEMSRFFHQNTIWPLALSWTGVPILYAVNKSTYGQLDSSIPFVGIIVLLAILGAINFIPRPQNKTWMFFMFTMFCFSSVVDLVLALEAQGFIRGYGSFYLLVGEEYLNTNYGVAVDWYDAIVHYGIYLAIISGLYNGSSVRSLGLFWAGSILKLESFEQKRLLLKIPANF